MSTIFHNRGGLLTIKNGTYVHLGGTDMAYVVDNSANYYGDARTIIEGGKLNSTYTAIRNRMEQNSHGASGKAILNVLGGEIYGTSRSIWAQASSTSTISPATGEITISGGNIGLIYTAYSAGSECMTTISGGTVSTFKGKVGELIVTENGKLEEAIILTTSGDEVEFVVDDNGNYIEAVAKINDENYSTLQKAIEAVQEGETITLIKDVEVTSPAYGQNALNITRAVNFTIDLNGNTLSADTGNSVVRFNITNSGATSNVTVTIKNGKVISGDNTWCTLMAAGINENIKAIFNLEDLVVENSKPGDLAIKAWENGVINAKNVTVNSTKGAGGFHALCGEILLDNCTVNQT